MAHSEMTKAAGLYQGTACRFRTAARFSKTYRCDVKKRLSYGHSNACNFSAVSVARPAYEERRQSYGLTTASHLSMMGRPGCGIPTAGHLSQSSLTDFDQINKAIMTDIHSGKKPIADSQSVPYLTENMVIRKGGAGTIYYYSQCLGFCPVKLMLNCVFDTSALWAFDLPNHPKHGDIWVRAIPDVRGSIESSAKSNCRQSQYCRYFMFQDFRVRQDCNTSALTPGQRSVDGFGKRAGLARIHSARPYMSLKNFAQSYSQALIGRGSRNG